MRPALPLRIALLLPMLAFGQAHGGCALSQSAPDVLTIATSEAGTCDGTTLRASLRTAIARHETGASQGGGKPGAFSNLSRTTNSNLFKLGMAPTSAPPPTLLVMPGGPGK